MNDVLVVDNVVTSAAAGGEAPGTLADAPSRARGRSFARAKDDPSVMLEVGNIAARSGDAAGAQAAWTEAIRLRPTGETADQARAALRQFDPPPPKQP